MLSTAALSGLRSRLAPPLRPPRGAPRNQSMDTARLACCVLLLDACASLALATCALSPAMSRAISALSLCAWLVSAADAALWARDAAGRVMGIALGVPLAAGDATSRDAASGVKPTALSLWPELTAQVCARLLDVACVCAAPFVSRPARAAIALLRLAARGGMLCAQLQGELDDRTRRAIDAVLAVRGRAEAAEARVLALEAECAAAALDAAAQRATCEALQEECATLGAALRIAAMAAARAGGAHAHAGEARGARTAGEGTTTARRRSASHGRQVA